MRKYFFVLMMLATPGCMGLPSLSDEPASKTPPAIHQPEAPPAPVTANQVTESNAYEMAEALRIELSKTEDQ